MLTCQPPFSWRCPLCLLCIPFPGLFLCGMNQFYERILGWHWLSVWSCQSGKRIPFLAEIVFEMESIGGYAPQKKSCVPIFMYRYTRHGLVFNLFLCHLYGHLIKDAPATKAAYTQACERVFNSVSENRFSPTRYMPTSAKNLCEKRYKYLT